GRRDRAGHGQEAGGDQGAAVPRRPVAGAHAPARPAPLTRARPPPPAGPPVAATGEQDRLRWADGVSVGSAPSTVRTPGRNPPPRPIVFRAGACSRLETAKERHLRTGRKIAEQGTALARLRVSDAGPDPRFRAVLRARLVAAAGDRGEDGPDPGRRQGTGRRG